MKIKEAYKLNNTLNPKLWDLETQKLLPEVRAKLVEIGDQFEAFLDCPISICDLQLVGSNCGYNYSDTSDLDLHIIANFAAVADSNDILGALYNAKKARFNDQYDIKIRGIEVEVYVEDVRTSVVSNGIYSVCDDKWIKKPVRKALPPEPDISKQVGKWEQLISNVCKSGVKEDIENTLNKLYMMRKNSIAVDGEYAVGNAVFKAIRDSGGLDELKEYLAKSISRELSLESLDRGQLINRLGDI